MRGGEGGKALDGLLRVAISPPIPLSYTSGGGAWQKICFLISVVTQLQLGHALGFQEAARGSAKAYHHPGWVAGAWQNLPLQQVALLPELVRPPRWQGRLAIACVSSLRCTAALSLGIATKEFTYADVLMSEKWCDGSVFVALHPSQCTEKCYGCACG